MQLIKRMMACVIAAALFTHCSVSKEAAGLKQQINGTWMLQSITTEGIEGKVTATIFNEASFNCFVGSSWNFIAENSTGMYNINTSGTECTGLTRPIRWSIYEPKNEPKQFQFKRLNDNKKDLDNGDGFRLEITSLSKTSMQLKSHITFEDKPAAYVYNFVKK